MSSTEGSPSGAPMMKLFFDEELMPLARQLREKRSELLLKGVDPALETYYMRRVKRTMSKEDFENASCANGKEFAARLVAHWRSIGGDPLCGLGGSLGQIADVVRVAEHDSADVSPFVYVMF